MLVVDDYADSAESMAALLQMDGHEVRTAHDGVTAIKMARQFKPGIVFLDIGLPGIDGYEVARAFRADPALREVHLVALTGYAQPEDVARAREAGFDGHLAKPPSIEAIERALATIVDQ